MKVHACKTPNLVTTSELTEGLRRLEKINRSAQVQLCIDFDITGIEIVCQCTGAYQYQQNLFESNV